MCGPGSHAGASISWNRFGKLITGKLFHGSATRSGCECAQLCVEMIIDDFSVPGHTSDVLGRPTPPCWTKRRAAPAGTAAPSLFLRMLVAVLGIARVCPERVPSPINYSDLFCSTCNQNRRKGGKRISGEIHLTLKTTLTERACACDIIHHKRSESDLRPRPVCPNKHSSVRGESCRIHKLTKINLPAPHMRLARVRQK